MGKPKPFFLGRVHLLNTQCHQNGCRPINFAANPTSRSQTLPLSALHSRSDRSRDRVFLARCVRFPAVRFTQRDKNPSLAHGIPSTERGEGISIRASSPSPLLRPQKPKMAQLWLCNKGKRGKRAAHNPSNIWYWHVFPFRHHRETIGTEGF